MKIIAVSDTHVRRFDELPERLVRLMDSADMVVHAGDFVSADVLDEFERRYEFVGVHGNSDDAEVKERLNETEVFEVEGVKIGLIHRGNFINEFHDLGYKARELGVDLLVFGHIHRFVVERFGRIIVACPGSPTQPRLSASSCAVISVEDGRVEIDYELVQEFACGIDVRLRT
ncbi:MAG: metallophosphoesterase [Archaeoglobi archaeon]|nr:metallophosphoesterase [Archaeoglobi archaeon]